MNWNTETRCLEEKTDYTLFYQMSSFVGADCNFYFVITTSIYINKIKATHLNRKVYISKSVPMTMKEVEKDLRVASKKLIKRMKESVK